MTDLELARTLLSNVRSAISRVADTNYQRRVWLLGEIPEIRDSFVEVYYQLQGADIDVIRDHRRALQCSDVEWELILMFLVRFMVYYSELNDVYALGGDHSRCGLDGGCKRGERCPRCRAAIILVVST